MRKTVVTGGAGFIGSNLAEELVARGYYVIVLDDLSSGKLGNIAELLKGKRGSIEFIQGSITDLPLLMKAFRGVEYVFHQAARARVPRSIKDPLKTNEININGTLNVLVAAKENDVCKVVYAASSSVYGNSPALPQREDFSPSPLSPYAVSKLTGEYYCNVFCHVYGLSTVSLRYFNVYGPKQDLDSQYATVIPAFINSLSQRTPPIIYGDGEQSRDFTFVKDIVRANLLAAENKADGVYNVGSGQNVTINQLFDTIASLMQEDLEPIHKEPRLSDPKHTLADISKAKEFGYQPEWNLQEGLAQTIGLYSTGE